MTPKTISYGILRALGIGIAIFVLGYFLFEIRSIILYIGIAAVVALIGRPLVYFLRKRLRLPGQMAVLLTLLLFFGIILGILALFIPVINQQSENLARIDFDQVKNNLELLNTQIRDYLGVRQVELFQSIKETDFIQNLDLKMLPQFMTTIFGKLGSVIIGIFAVLFISYFLLKDSNLLLNSLMVFSRKGKEGQFKFIFNKIKRLLSRYFVGLTIQIFILFVLYTILLFIFDIQNPVVVAFICAFLNIVPYIGPLAAGVLMVFFVVSNHLGADFSTVILPNTLYVLAGYLVTQLIDVIINQPLIFGHSVKSHPLEIFLVILIAGILFGVFGMIVAVPFYTALKVIAKEALGDYKIVQKLTQNL